MYKTLESTAGWFNNERVIHSIKTGIACVLGYLVTRYSGFLPLDSWLVTTICVVMCAQIYVGDAFQRSYQRFLGTVLGCLFAVFMLIAFGISDEVIIIAILIATVVFSYIATGTENMVYIGVHGALTTVIILINTKLSLTLAGIRFTEICLGIIIATLVSKFIFPLHARDHMMRAQGVTLTKLRDYYTNALVTQKFEIHSLEYYELDESIGDALIKQRQLAKTATKGWFEPAFDRIVFLKSIYSEKEILRAMNVMQNSLVDFLKFRPNFIEPVAVKEFHEEVVKLFNELIDISKIKRQPLAKTELDSLSSLNEMKKTLEEALRTSNKQEAICLSAYIYAAELLVRHLSKIADFYRIPENKRKIL